MSMANFDIIEYQKRVINDLTAENKALKAELQAVKNTRIKIQYHNEELTIREICERLDDLQNKVNKYECEIRKYAESCDDCNFCKMED